MIDREQELADAVRIVVREVWESVNAADKLEGGRRQAFPPSQEPVAIAFGDPIDEVMMRRNSSREVATWDQPRRDFLSRAISSRSASCRSRARPSRRASMRASSS